MELPAEEAGIISLKAAEGDVVKVGQVVCLIDTAAPRPAGTSAPAAPAKEAAPAKVEEKKVEAPVKEEKAVNPNPVNEKTSYASGTPSPAAAKTMAETGNLQAQELLANERAKIMWEELINATKNANSNLMQATAYKLASEWSTGEFTNWKTWTGLAEDAVGLVFDGVKAFKQPVRAKGTNITNNYASGMKPIK